MKAPLSLSVLLRLAFLGARPRPASADIPWPEYNQQCRDDAGPPYEDDVPGVPYHAGSAAYPVLREGRECADPLKFACGVRPDAKTAYLEGPIMCGDKGWYCRIFNDEANGWPNVNLNTDVNFGQCNTEAAFEPWGYDQDGHCHGSSYDNTYYWWIRDHWHRQYNGRVRCCCGWYEGGTQPVTQGRIANRCDYRRLVTQSEDLSSCRDANEDHGLGFEGGCDSQYADQIGSPIPEDDSVCWEIERFGYTEEGGDVPTFSPTVTPKPTPPAVPTPETNAPTDTSAPTTPVAPPESTPEPTKAATPVPTSPPTPLEVTPEPTKAVTPDPTPEPTNPPSPKPTSNPTQVATPNPTAPSPPQPVGNERAVVCGRGYDCSEGDGLYDEVNMNEFRPVRCCRDCTNDGSCGRSWKQKCEEFDPEVFSRTKFGGTCYEEDFCTAMDICANKGGRLCTPSEVLESCAQRSGRRGCGFDVEMIWACMWEDGECESDAECCSGKCESGVCQAAEAGMC